MGLVLQVILIAACIFWAVVRPKSRRPSIWGAGAGIVLGCWFVAPHFLKANHIHPRSWQQWMILDGELSLLFLVLGGMLGFLACLPLSIWEAVFRKRLTDAIWEAAAISVLPVAYVIFSAVVVWISFARRVSWLAFGPVLLQSIAVSALLAIGVAAALRIARRVTPKPTAAVAWLVIASGVIGFSILPLRIGRDLRAAAAVQTPLQPQSMPTTSRLLVIGLDSGTWNIIQPLLDQGRLPTLQALIQSGIRGNVKAAWPPYWSAPAWGAIATGHSADEIGIHEDLMVSAPGLDPIELRLVIDPLLNPILAIQFLLSKAGVLAARQPARHDLGLPPIWEMLSSAGVDTAVINFPFTYPARDQAKIVISNYIDRDVWRLVGARFDDAKDVISPASDRQKWMDELARPLDETSLRRILPQQDWPKPPDALIDPVQHVHNAWTLTTHALDMTEEIATTHPEIGVLMVYVGGFDAVCHAFWQYRFPEDFPSDPPRPEDVKVLGPVIDRFIEYLDARIGALIRSAGPDTNVIVVSDHGHQTNKHYALWRGFHSPTGILIAAGPDIPHRAEAIDVSYLDIVPTMLDLEHFSVPASFSGRSLLFGDSAGTMNLSAVRASAKR